jgi:hypothetical protein
MGGSLGSGLLAPGGGGRIHPSVSAWTRTAPCVAQMGAHRSYRKPGQRRPADRDVPLEVGTDDMGELGGRAVAGVVGAAGRFSLFMVYSEPRVQHAVLAYRFHYAVHRCPLVWQRIRYPP